MSILSLSDLNLHDSGLLDVTVGKDEDDNDQVILHLDYLNNYVSFTTSRKALVFSNCRKAILDFNFGLEGRDSLRGGREVKGSTLLEDTREKWQKVGVALSDEFKHFRIETNSMASVIHIVAERVELSDE